MKSITLKGRWQDAITNAIKNNCFDVLQFIFRNHTDLNFRDNILRVAVQHKRHNIIHLFNEVKYKTKRNMFGSNVLSNPENLQYDVYLAAINNDPKTIKLLHEYGNVQYNLGGSVVRFKGEGWLFPYYDKIPLIEAAKLGYIEVVRSFIELGGDEPLDIYCSPLGYSSLQGDSQYLSAIIPAINNRDVDMIKLIINNDGGWPISDKHFIELWDILLKNNALDPMEKLIERITSNKREGFFRLCS